jgi:hypothetical protein
LAPSGRRRKQPLDLPKPVDAASIVAGLARLVELFAEGELSDRDLTSLSQIYSAAAEALRGVDLEQRLAALEARLGDGPRLVA